MSSNVRYQPLPNNLFRVRVPAICTYSQAERDLYGLPMDKVYNHWNGKTTELQKAYNELVRCMLPLDRIIDIYIEGYPVYLTDKEELTKIYTLLDQYVSGYNNMENFSPNVGVVVDDRMEKIQFFLKEIFGWNKGDIIRGLTNSNSNGWGVDIPLMRVKPTADVINVNIRPQDNQRVGVLAGYKSYDQFQSPNTVNPVPAYNNYNSPNSYYPEQNIGPQMNQYDYQPAVMNVRTIDTGDLNSNVPKTNDYMQIFEQAPQIDLNSIQFQNTYRKTYK